MNLLKKASDLRQPPARIVAAAQSILFGGDIVSDYYHEDFAGMSGLILGK